MVPPELGEAGEDAELLPGSEPQSAPHSPKPPSPSKKSRVEISPEKTQRPESEEADPLAGLPSDQRGLGALMLMMQRNLSTELQATRGQLQRSEEESMRRHEILLAANDRNERSIAEAHKEIQKVMSVTDGLGKDIKDIHNEATERDKQFNELENRLNDKMRDMLQHTQSGFELVAGDPLTKGPQRRG